MSSFIAILLNPKIHRLHLHIYQLSLFLFLSNSQTLCCCFLPFLLVFNNLCLCYLKHTHSFFHSKTLFYSVVLDMEETMCLGYQFVPTDKQLITHYLSAKVNNQPLPYNGITECDLYGDKSPWEIFNEKEKRYVFTKLRRVGKKRVARTAGVGTWHGNNSGDDICDPKTKNVIGIKKTFTFKVKPDKNKHVSSKTEGNWIMHEFSLAGENCSDYVICRVEKKIKKKEKQEDDDDDDDDDDDEVEQVGDQGALSTCAANSVNESQVPSTNAVPSYDDYVVWYNQFYEVTTSNTFAAANSVNEGQASTTSAVLASYHDYVVSPNQFDEVLYTTPMATSHTCTAASSINEGQASSSTAVAFYDGYAVSANQLDGEDGMGNLSDNLCTFNDLDSLPDFLLGDNELPNLQEGDLSMEKLTNFVDSLINIPE